MTRFRRVIWVATAVATGLVLVSAVAAAPGDKPLTLRGTQIVVDQQTGSYRMTGSLVGSWNITAFTTHYAGVDGRFVGSGKELFRGCLDSNRSGACDAGEPAGSLRFNFVYWATYKPGTEVLVRGECVHPVVGGSGAFAKAKGVIHMVDVPAKSGVRTTYSGTLAVPGLDVSSAAPAPVRRPASIGAATGVGGGCGS
jgi:hypothetical protein